MTKKQKATQKPLFGFYTRRSFEPLKMTIAIATFSAALLIVLAMLLSGVV